MLQTIYNTMLTQTTSRGIWDGFTWADDRNWHDGAGCGYQSHNGPDGHGGCGMSSQYYGDFMQAAATEYNSTNIGQYARQWIATVNPAIGSIFRRPLTREDRVWPSRICRRPVYSLRRAIHVRP